MTVTGRPPAASGQLEARPVEKRKGSSKRRTSMGMVQSASVVSVSASQAALEEADRPPTDAGDMPAAAAADSGAHTPDMLEAGSPGDRGGSPPATDPAPTAHHPDADLASIHSLEPESRPDLGGDPPRSRSRSSSSRRRDPGDPDKPRRTRRSDPADPDRPRRTDPNDPARPRRSRRTDPSALDAESGVSAARVVGSGSSVRTRGTTSRGRPERALSPTFADEQDGMRRHAAERSQRAGPGSATAPSAHHAAARQSQAQATSPIAQPTTPGGLPADFFLPRVSKEFYIWEKSQLGQLPTGWEMLQSRGSDPADPHPSFSGPKTLYIDHLNQQTTWIDPRTEKTRTMNILETKYGELPYGWDECVDKDIGVYYLDHTMQTTYLDPPWDERVRFQVAVLANFITEQTRRMQLLQDRAKMDDAARAAEASRRVTELEAMHKNLSVEIERLEALEAESRRRIGLEGLKHGSRGLLEDINLEGLTPEEIEVELMRAEKLRHELLQEQSLIEVEELRSQLQDVDDEIRLERMLLNEDAETCSTIADMLAERLNALRAARMPAPGERRPGQEDDDSDAPAEDTTSNIANRTEAIRAELMEAERDVRDERERRRRAEAELLQFQMNIMRGPARDEDDDPDEDSQSQARRRRRRATASAIAAANRRREKEEGLARGGEATGPGAGPGAGSTPRANSLAGELGADIRRLHMRLQQQRLEVETFERARAERSAAAATAAEDPERPAAGPPVDQTSRKIREMHGMVEASESVREAVVTNYNPDKSSFQERMLFFAANAANNKSPPPVPRKLW
ncbi:hypothetical protein H696_02608 [Fonticula alba]|uniref:WW domain-containing protein n=1 Tax=Fonticula alba TaxID=691883 RepID=A0A058Z8M6_FONAL|nr:hypothetical protein H696_02608 [Fonticula alba]KCV70278.1 hypothetical protein H696_02608 [Fonticula alba]|eukprot:XP_009494794.1 hypothetical protein H696_02608 [Fonticula alba]